jgi:NAD(P)-dependent dehydrogenase (short-subunit alcohol dehydrogenase family)
MISAPASGATASRRPSPTASVASADGARDMVQRAIDEFGQLDIVVNNAGIVPNGQGIAELRDEEWDRMLGVTSAAALTCCGRHGRTWSGPRPAAS